MRRRIQQRAAASTCNAFGQLGAVGVPKQHEIHRIDFPRELRRRFVKVLAKWVVVRFACVPSQRWKPRDNVFKPAHRCIQRFVMHDVVNKAR